jgi:hypothetical protein
MKMVTSTKDLSFPKHNFGIRAGEVKPLPEDKEAQARILAEPEISEVLNKSADTLKK